MSELYEDAQRLADIGDRVLSGEPIENFDLGEYEILVVASYCRRAIEKFMPDPDKDTA